MNTYNMYTCTSCIGYMYIIGALPFRCIYIYTSMADGSGPNPPPIIKTRN